MHKTKFQYWMDSNTTSSSINYYTRAALENIYCITILDVYYVWWCCAWTYQRYQHQPSKLLSLDQTPPSSSGSLCSLCRRPRPGCSYPASPRSTTSWWRQPKSRWRCFYTSSLVIWLLLGSFGHLNFKKWKNQVGSKKLFFSTFLSRIGET